MSLCADFLKKVHFFAHNYYVRKSDLFFSKTLCKSDLLPNDESLQVANWQIDTDTLI